MCSRVTQLLLLATVIVLAATLARRSGVASQAAPALNAEVGATGFARASDDSSVVVESALLGGLDVLALDHETLLSPEAAAFAQAAVSDDVQHSNVDNVGDDQNAQGPDQSPDGATRFPPPPPGDRSMNGLGGLGRDGDRRPGMPQRDGLRGDGGRERGGPWTQHGPRMMMNPEMIARCLEVASEVDKELGTRLADSRQKNPEEFDRSMRAGGFGRRLLALAELKQRDPDLYRAKLGELSQAVQIERAAKQLREARKNGSQGEIDVYENQLRSLLQIQLAMSIKARTELLCRLDERIAELRGEIERDAQNFQGIIDARLKVLANASAPQAKPPVPQQ